MQLGPSLRRSGYARLHIRKRNGARCSAFPARALHECMFLSAPAKASVGARQISGSLSPLQRMQ